MEIIGDDKKLRALFSEARSADAAAAPGFTAVWHRAGSRSLKPRRVFNLSLAAVTALLAIALGSLAVWSMFFKPSNAKYEASGVLNAPQSIAASIDRHDQQPIETPAYTPPLKPPHRAMRVRVRSAAQNESLVAQNKTTRATTIDTWQSPTAALLSSPTDELFKSLPQLNQNANEVKSSLPGKSNEKEK